MEASSTVRMCSNNQTAWAEDVNANSVAEAANVVGQRYIGHGFESCTYVKVFRLPSHLITFGDDFADIAYQCSQ